MTRNGAGQNWNDVQHRLFSLMEMGYQFLRTDDNGETWRGSCAGGLPIDWLLQRGSFQGHIVTNPAGREALFAPRKAAVPPPDVREAGE